eukprot:Tbor_TRINITY_DN5086_c0_g1::TRINITY_DN5086_c0_g1_i1::g.14036::m.14036
MSDPYGEDFESSSTDSPLSDLNSNKERESIKQGETTNPSQSDKAAPINIATKSSSNIDSNSDSSDNTKSNIAPSTGANINNSTASVTLIHEVSKSDETACHLTEIKPPATSDVCAMLNVSSTTAPYNDTITEIVAVQSKEQQSSDNIKPMNSDHITCEEAEEMKKAIAIIEQYMKKEANSYSAKDRRVRQHGNYSGTPQKESLLSIGGAVYRFNPASSVAPYGPAAGSIGPTRNTSPETSLVEMAVCQRSEKRAIERAYINLLMGKPVDIKHISYKNSQGRYSCVTSSYMTETCSGQPLTGSLGSLSRTGSTNKVSCSQETEKVPHDSSSDNCSSIRWPKFPDDFLPAQDIFSAAALDDVDYINNAIEKILSSGEAQNENNIPFKQSESVVTTAKQVDGTGCGMELLSSFSRKIPLPTAARERLWDYINSAGYISTSAANKSVAHQSYGLKKMGGIYVIGHGGKATPLQLAAACGSCCAVKTLLQAGAIDEGCPGPARVGHKRGEGKYEKPFVCSLPRPSLIAESNGFESMKLIFDAYSLHSKRKKIKKDNQVKVGDKDM